MRQFFVSLSVLAVISASINVTHPVFGTTVQEQGKEQGKDAAKPQDNEEDISERFRGFFPKDTEDNGYSLLVSEAGDLVTGKLLGPNGAWNFGGLIANDKLEAKTVNEKTKIPCVFKLSRELGKINVEIVADAVDDKTAPPKPTKITFRKPAGPSDPLVGVWRDKRSTLVIIGTAPHYQLVYIKGDQIAAATAERLDSTPSLSGKITLQGAGKKSEFLAMRDHGHILFKIDEEVHAKDEEEIHTLYEGLIPEVDVVNPLSEKGEPFPSTTKSSGVAGQTGSDENTKSPWVGTWHDDKVTVVFKGDSKKLRGTVSKGGATYALTIDTFDSEGKAMEGSFLAANTRFEFMSGCNGEGLTFISGSAILSLHK